MGTLQQQLKLSRSVTSARISSELFRFIKSIEKEIFDLNIKQIEQAEDAKGLPLINKDTSFSGVYSQTTEDIAAAEKPILPKRAGELYNFGYTGEFLGNFEMTLFKDHVEIFSTGEGSGEKKAFFDGYQSLYGLAPESIKQIIETRLIPFLHNYSRQSLRL